MNKLKKILRSLLIILAAVLLFSAVGFVIWGNNAASPMPEALAALQSDQAVNVETGNWLVFSPMDTQPTSGLIFYPGGRVDYRAYAPAARQLAQQGYLVVIVRMPLNLAVFNPNAAAKVIETYPQITHWAVGGHSLGGAMAANFVYTHPNMVEGLVLWAAYPAESNDLSNSTVEVTSISGTLDGLATPEKIEASRGLLPLDTTWTFIPGGNHAQFGWYGEQSGDNAAEISRNEQQTRIVAATLLLLEEIQQ